MTTRIPEAALIRIVQSYYDAVDSRDADRIGSLYLPAPSTTLQFNADPPIVTIEAIKAFSAQFTQAVAGIKHSMIEIWTNPLKGDVVPVDLPPPRSSSTVHRGIYCPSNLLNSQRFGSDESCAPGGIHLYHRQASGEVRLGPQYV